MKATGEARGAAAVTGVVFGRVTQAVKDEVRWVVERLERRRSEAIRRHPARFIRRLRRARTVLVLCQGNVSRSVFASQLLAIALRGRAVPAIRSAGLATVPGWRAHPRVVQRCQALNIDIAHHASASVTAEMMKAADVVFVMEVSHLVAITRRFFRARRKAFLLTSLAPDVALEIPDPAGKPDPDVDACMDHVFRAVNPLIDILLGPARAVTS
jgi:protein-tyrosine-phosphatase